MYLSSSFTVQWRPQRGSLPLLSPRFLQSWGRVELSVGGHVCYLSFFPSLCVLSQPCLCVHLVCFLFFCLGSEGTGCVLCLACADAHRAAFVWECDNIIIPHLHFEAVFSFSVQQASGDLFLCYADNVQCCYDFLWSLWWECQLFTVKKLGTKQGWYC